MKILHIVRGFNYTSVYKNLLSALHEKAIDIEVYNPENINSDISNNPNMYSFRLYTSEIIKRFDKYIYFTKIYRMKNDIIKHFNINQISIIHAHSLFSDGALAYELFKKYQIPYIVTVRNTDINKYYKYALHLRLYAEKILLNASRIIFISPKYKEQFAFKYITKKNQHIINKKMSIITNGVDPFWLKNKYDTKRLINNRKMKILSVGVVDKNKNMLKLVQACNHLIKAGISIELTLVGKIVDKRYYNKISRFAFIKHIDNLNKEDLLKQYRCNDIFAMPSIHETFGLVYVEAMTQGLPVVYSNGQGFDGHFDNGVIGYSVNCRNSKDIAEKIKLIMSNYINLSQNCTYLSDDFSWEKISNKIINLYNELLLRNLEHEQ